MRNGVDIFLLTEVTTLKHLIDFLRRGKRLENPSFMPKPLSDTMAKCWEKIPKTDQLSLNSSKTNLTSCWMAMSKIST